MVRCGYHRCQCNSLCLFLVYSSPGISSGSKTGVERLIGTDQIRLPLRLKESASLENFFCEGNREAVGFLRSLIASDGPCVVFLHGPDGAGKSHLLQAYCRLTLQSSKVPFYASLAMQESSPEMISGLEGADTVCLDDVDAVASDSAIKIPQKNNITAILLRIFSLKNTSSNKKANDKKSR